MQLSTQSLSINTFFLAISMGCLVTSGYVFTCEQDTHTKNVSALRDSIVSYSTKTLKSIQQKEPIFQSRIALSHLKNGMYKLFVYHKKDFIIAMWNPKIENHLSDGSFYFKDGNTITKNSDIEEQQKELICGIADLGKKLLKMAFPLDPNKTSQKLARFTILKNGEEFYKCPESLKKEFLSDAQNQIKEFKSFQEKLSKQPIIFNELAYESYEVDMKDLCKRFKDLNS